jgi:inhibitor of KinA sporulation pathway (predicted exonuclease)/predicted RNA-binding Zn-ribbon protein involved in translation (DUF1610 family)
VHYIIIDLEWNNAYSRNDQRFINEIIEIGAVKLDENFRETGRFQEFIRSRLTRHLCSRVKDLTSITNQDMRGGISLEHAVEKYTEWAGRDHVTLSWSNTDIYVLLDNLRSFMGLEAIPFIEKYADMQKFVQRRMGIDGNQISLTAAAEKMGIDFTEFAAHRALGDCLVCAELLRRTYYDGGLDEYITDTRDPKYYARLSFKPYIISDLNDPDIDRNELRFRCENCGKFARRRSKWQFRSRAFRADFRCRNCGSEFTARIRFKRTYDGVIITRGLVLPQPADAQASKPDRSVREKTEHADPKPEQNTQAGSSDAGLQSANT